MRRLTVFLLIIFTQQVSFGQVESPKKAFYVSPEYMIGRIVPNYVNNFPQSDLQHGLGLSLGTMQLDSNNSWSKYFNHPQTGVMLFYSYLGNNDIFGHQFSAMAYASFNVFNRKRKPYFLKIGLGAAYFTTHYDSISNRRNVNVGSPFMWSFQAAAYKTLSEKKGLNIKAGLIFSHASNGHTQLPNFGTNSLLLSINSQFYNKKHENYLLTSNRQQNRSGKKRNYLLGYSQGFGFHEYGDKDGPVGGSKEAVHSSYLSVGKVYNSHFRFNLGLTYRYYAIYYDQIQNRKLTEYSDNPKWSSSNIVAFVGGEYYLGHVGIEAELGVNLHKPFYDQFEKDFPLNKQFKGYMKFKSHFKRLFSTRLGLNLYLINANKLPRHNIFTGAHIKANAGQADFSELVIGYQYRIK